jgi:thiol-disulfide isomerase/thioredoxin
LASYVSKKKGGEEHISVIVRVVPPKARVLTLFLSLSFPPSHPTPHQVCPAGWKPGDKTMKADPEGSLEYFASGATEESEVDPLAGGPRVVTAKDGKHLKELLGKKGKVVLDFVAGWCGKCKQIMPFVNELSETHAGEVTFVKVDTTEDSLAEAVAEHGVSVLPAFHFFKDGKVFGTPVVGYKKTPLKDAVAALAKK